MQPTRHQTPRRTFANRTLLEWFSSLPVFFFLLLTIVLSGGTIIHSQLLKFGQQEWNDYFKLRAGSNIEAPTCNPNPDIDAEVKKAVAAKKKEAASDPLNSILGASKVDPNAIRQSFLSARDNCRSAIASYKEIQSRRTLTVRAYSSVETGLAYLVKTLGNYKELLLCLLVLFAAITATLTRHHIAIRPARTVKDHYVSTSAQLVANTILLVSAIVYRQSDVASIKSGVTVSDFYLHDLWITGFALLTLISLYQLIRAPRNLESGGTWGKSILTVPLYCFMCILANLHFYTHGYYEGSSVYLNMMLEFSTLFLNLALYGWVGMLLTQTRMMHLVFDSLRPWKMSPELLSLVLLVIVAVPTAYTGASGIFVLAAGATIYNELRRAGARKQLSLAVTAMSGSMGVVLNPCLLVVIIAALNKSVTTDELFASGFKMFIVSAVLFFIVSQFTRKSPARIAPFSEALPESLRRMKALIPYGVILVLTLVFFDQVLNRRLDEFSAPIILPIFLLLVLFYEYVLRRPTKEELEQDHKDLMIGEKADTMEGAVRVSTNETVGPIGALLMLMALSVSASGLVERSGLMDMLPAHLPSVWITMTITLVGMVLVGMFMDPYGAIIVVNATIAQWAVHNGISPLHFWILALVAFELGYLMPPVGLNHLLTRQVIGDDEALSAEIKTGSFWHRHEKFLLPIAVMLPALLLVAYVPLASHSIHHWLFQQMSSGQ